MHKGHPWLPAHLTEHGEAIAALMEQGKGDHVIAEALGISRFKVRVLMKHIRERPAERWPEPVDAPFQFDDLGDTGRVWSRKGSPIRTVDELLEAAEVDLDVWRPYDGVVGTWGGMAKMKAPDGSDEIVQLTNHKVSVKLERRFDVGLRPPAILPRRGSTNPVAKTADLVTTLFIPDMQAGFRWNEHRTYLDPLHDRGVLDCAVQLAERLQPDTIVFLGDMLDFAALSLKFPRPPSLRGCDKPAIWELHWWIAQFRQACPSSTLR